MAGKSDYYAKTRFAEVIRFRLDERIGLCSTVEDRNEKLQASDINGTSLTLVRINAPDKY